MTKEKENAAIISQEEIAHGIYSMWIRTKAAETAEPGAVYLDVYKRRKQTSSAPDQYLRDRQRERRTARCIPCYRRKYRNRAFFTDGRRRYDPCDRTVGKWIPAGESIRKTGVSHRGGIGVPPILELAKQIGCEKKQIIVGYRNDETFLKTEFEQNGEVYISTEDGSAGTKGNVMDAIRENGLEADIIYACGPTPMLRAIKNYAEENGIECYISLEERMACGMEHVLHVYARRKKKIITVMCITKESVKTVRYFCQRRWKSDEYKSDDRRSGME